MAMHKLGKLKFKLSGDGLAFRFGDGDIRRLSFGKKKKGGSEGDDYNAEAFSDVEGYDEEYGYDEDMNQEDYASDEYSDGYGRREYDEDYDDQYEDSAYDEDYDDSEYADDEYADEEYDDGYADEYVDEAYYDDGDYNEEYDDRYLDEDADDYGEASYNEGSAFMRYVDENDWVSFLLLFVLPPLGIYLLWRRMRFEKPVRIAVSAASAVWFIIVVVLLISMGLKGGDDVTKQPTNLILQSPMATADATVAPTTDPLDGIVPAVTQDALAPDATATPIPSTNSDGSASGASTGNTVYMPATGLYYHNTDSCSGIGSGVKVSRVTLDVAENKKMAPCPVCYEGQTYCYATVNGKYYHTNSTCSGMQNASKITVASAQKYGKTACPACVSGKVNTLSNSGLKFATSSTKDQSGITVYATKNGKYFHTKSNCSGMTNASSGSLLSAMLYGKTACPECAASAGTLVYATKNGTYYHTKSNCSGMENAYTITLAEALIIGKQKCSVCMKANSSSDMTAASITDDSTVYVYGTKGGQYYHTKKNCSGMNNASKYTLKSMLAAGRAACPVCASSASNIVYATAGGAYYHSYKTCSGIKNAVAGTLAKALAYGYKRCPNCWSGNTPVTNPTVNESSDNTSSSGIVGEASACGTYVYAVKNGSHYHTKSTCSGMSGASKIALETAVKYGLTPCQSCAAYADNTVYSTKNGAYFHATADCSGMVNASKRTMEEAILMGQTACPTCVENYKSNNSSASQTPTTNLVSSGTYKAGTSGIKVYATAEGKYFHTKSACGGQTNASYITLETALNYGKVGCPTCASSANTGVYAVKGGKYYHYSKACAGNGAAGGTRAEALAYGFDPCPYCVSKTQAIVSSNTYKAGTSGIKVYASISGKYYHTDSACAGRSASQITLETALNYGKIACPSCAASASKTVYASKGQSYYHSSASCSGAGSTAGTFASALAYGLKACPYCIGGSESYEESVVKYAAPGSTQVYVNLDSDLLYYHSASSCDDAGMSGGTKVTLEFVLKWGYHACPYCTPPTSIG